MNFMFYNIHLEQEIFLILHYLTVVYPGLFSTVPNKRLIHTDFLGFNA